MRRHLYSIIGFSIGLLAGLLASARLAVPEGRVIARPGDTGSGQGAALSPACATRPNSSGHGTTEAVALGHLEAIRRLNSVLVQKFHVPVLENGFVSDNFVQAYGLTPQERGAMDSLIAETQQRMEAIELRNASVTLAPDGKAKISVPAYPKDGAVLYDDFLRNVNLVLGDARFGYFLELSEASMEGNLTLRYFGIESLSYVITDSHDQPQHGWMSSGSSWDDETGARARSYAGDLHWLASAHPGLYEKVLASTGWKPLPVDQIRRFARTRPVHSK